MRHVPGIGWRLVLALVMGVAGVAWDPAPATATAPATGAATTTARVAGRPLATGPTTTAALPPPKAWILVDADTGNVVDAGNDRVRLPPASLTKVITALAAANLPSDLPVTVSARAAAVPADKLFMKPGQVWTADEMLHALLISSANDAAVALAEQIGTTVEGFQAVLTQTASDLGMADSPVLNDPAGLDGPDGVGGGNFVSARDLAIAGRALLAVPTLATIVATPVYYFDGPDNVHHRLTNHNYPFLTTYAGAIGLKTGFTSRAGSCLMAAATVGGRTMLAVVLNSANPTQAATTLLDKGFATAVATESAVERLPAINRAALSNLGVSSRTRSTAAAPTPAAVEGAPARRGSPGGAAVVTGSHPDAPSWLLPTAAAVTALLGLMAAVRRRGAQVRRRRHAAARDPFEL